MYRRILQLSKIYTVSHEFYTIPTRFAGHSKWANIRHIKGLKDAERANLFMKLARQMKVAIQEGGSADPNVNLKLDQIIAQAKRAYMPSATIQNVLKSNQSDKKKCKSHIFEIKGPGSCLVLCEVFTDSLHLLKQNIASILRKNSSKYCEGIINMFEEKGIIEVEISSETSKSKSQLLEEATDNAIEAGAEEVLEIEENILQFVCGSTNLKAVTNNLEKCGYSVISASVEYVPLKFQLLNDKEMNSYIALTEKLGALPEVTRISHNIDE